MMLPPVAKRVSTVHPYLPNVPDYYHWLKDTSKSGKREDVMEYMNAEEAYAQEQFAKTSYLADTIYEEILTRIVENDQEVPYYNNNYWYYTRTVEGEQYSLYCRRFQSIDAPEQVYLNPNLFKEFSTIFVTHVSVSPSGKLLAYVMDTAGDEKYTIYFKNLETGEPLSDQITDSAQHVEWGKDDTSVYYFSQDDLLRPDKLYRHIIGQDNASDVMLVHNADEKFYGKLQKSASTRFLFAIISSQQTNETHYIDLESESLELKCFWPREHNHLYSVDHQDDFFLIVTNGGGKFLNGLLQRTRIENTDKSQWEDVLKYNPYQPINKILAFKNFAVAVERIDGIEYPRVIESLDTANETSYVVQYDGDIFQLDLAANRQDYNSDSFRIRLANQLTPWKTLEYNVKSRTIKTLKKNNGFDGSKYTLRRVFAPIPKHTRISAPFDTPVPDYIPITLLYRTDLFKSDAPNKLHLMAYGAYNSAIPPYFSPSSFSLVDRGIIAATAHIRGGSELGRGWYETAKFLNKKNSFTDLIACTDYLVSEGITRAELLAIEGGSAGGLLVGAVMNMKPDICHAVIAFVPFVDMLNTMMDPSLPVTISDYEEWGNPNEKEYFDYMLSYSPYENIKPNVKYPNIFAKTGFNDPRLGYWEPAKWVAKLRASNTNGGADDPDKSIIILHCKHGSGHAGVTGRYGIYKDRSRDIAFVISQLDASEVKLNAAKRWRKVTKTTVTTIPTDAARGRPKLNGKTFVADNGNRLRGPFDSTEWTNAAPEANYAALRNLGFNAVHLYAENFDTTLAAGNRAAQVDLAVKYAGDNGLYVILVLANGGKNGDYSLSYAEAFWKFYAARYAAQTHVLFEIQNEPVSWGPPYNSASANPPGAINLEVQAYKIIRQYAPESPILFFSYSVLGYSGNTQAILSDIQAVNTQIHGNANAKWTNEAVAFHGYGGVANTKTVISGLLSAGYPAVMTEFGTVNNAIDTSFVSTLESLGVSWLDFQGIKTNDVSTYVLTSSLYQTPVKNVGLCWPSDFGTFPCNKAA
ncbi:hypothetical protein HK100_012156 [Physocladia obscura]|uniref:Prolyl endopeptidase-like n=1 Tax=Physocladia obscura TaxID=109957 RepID=A0AAD5T063_9FUNG|nr:hypothetical protein HK100_012156 [Physocladia obscura]